jgi:group II intron reverse transcriptase/maturase
MWAALHRIERDKRKAPGVDGMMVDELRPFLRKTWPAIREELLQGTYQPQPVRRVEIPKPTGGKRKLGIPTVLDRLIQQALLQVLDPIFDVTFAAESYGFRKGRSAHEAVEAARQHVEDGHRWVVDMDLEQFFDRVNHDILMSRVARQVADKRMLRLLRRYLQAGVMVGGVKVRTEEGTPQGGPISPLLANILLTDLDRELQKRGHRFVRYADDCNIYVRSQRAGERVLASLKRFLWNKLKLRVNDKKSAVDRPGRRQFLGFSFYNRRGKVRIWLAPRSKQRVQDRLRSLTSRTWSISMEARINRLNSYLGGWLAYFAPADMKGFLRDLGGWLRRRLRACVWKQWKRVRTRYRKLRALGVAEWRVHLTANSRRGPWFMAAGPLNPILNNAYWRACGLLSLTDRYLALRQR